MSPFAGSLAIGLLLLMVVAIGVLHKWLSRRRAKSRQFNFEIQEIAARQVAAAAAIRAIEDAAQLLRDLSRNRQEMAEVAVRLIATYWDRLRGTSTSEPVVPVNRGEYGAAARVLLSVADQAELNAILRLQLVGAVDSRVARKLVAEIERGVSLRQRADTPQSSGV